MEYIKKFETFDFNQTLPITSKSDLTMYYSCDECDALWQSFNENNDKCRFCKSGEIEELDEDEYFDLVESRLEDDEVEDLRSERVKDNFVSLLSLEKDKKKYVD